LSASCGPNLFLTELGYYLSYAAAQRIVKSPVGHIVNYMRPNNGTPRKPSSGLPSWPGPNQCSRRIHIIADQMVAPTGLRLTRGAASAGLSARVVTQPNSRTHFWRRRAVRSTGTYREVGGGPRICANHARPKKPCHARTAGSARAPQAKASGRHGQRRAVAPAASNQPATRRRARQSGATQSRVSRPRCRAPASP
jgi:hypothetical protein